MFLANIAARAMGIEAGNSMKRLPWALLLFTCAIPIGSQAADCYKYEPEKSHVPGTLASRSDASGGDALMLVVDEPLCVDGGEDAELNKPEAGLKELQVLYKDPHRMKVLIGKKVQIDGWLFHKDSEEHLTEVLIDAKKIKPASY